DHETIFWETYLTAARSEDESRIKDWEGNTGSILTFTGLFAATVAAFVIESYKSLSPDSGDQTVTLLAQILEVTKNNTAQTTESSEPFQAPLTTIAANVLWFCSLSAALMCALLATLVQQWSRDYMRDINKQRTLDAGMRSRALNHIYIRMGVNRYGIDHVVGWLVALLHMSVLLFAVGLLLFLYPINKAVAGCTMFVVGLSSIIYAIVSLMPLFDNSCPYRTPLTY
ncbi:hypothetical protein PENSPDRAFT_697953, partial [Peniophora sp. CONT]